MPYIPNKKRRLELDEIVGLMKELEMDYDGEMNYVLFKLCKENVPKSYKQLKAFKGELNECRDEIQRRLLGPLEEFKKDNNGDV